ncbi:hypothetical protein OG292_24850 [Streptomyces sp. NBC_01511]|uniref:hypothetical protein n=1 Tax=unclassified Streptomyces TaxID=2593676 RepID=UPI003868569F
MKSILELIGFGLVAAGVTGLLAHWIDWMPTVFGFFRFILPDGYEVPGHVVATLLGLAVIFATDAAKKKASA